MQDHGFWLMIILMIILSYFVMSNVMLTFRNGVYNHINKAYMALLMGSLMGIIYYVIMIVNGHCSIITWYGLILWITITIIFIIIINRQLLINDDQFLKSMIEHHDAALVMAESIKEKTKDPEINNLAANIIRTQQNEINWMQQKLNKINNLIYSIRYILQENLEVFRWHRHQYSVVMY